MQGNNQGVLYLHVTERLILTSSFSHFLTSSLSNYLVPLLRAETGCERFIWPQEHWRVLIQHANTIWNVFDRQLLHFLD